MNPERGFYTTAYLHTARDLTYVRQQNKSLVYVAAHLDKYLGSNHSQDLPQSFLSDIQLGFDAVRRAGLKAVVRFQYDDGEGYPGGANDAPESWMLRHIQQIAPVVQKNVDVIFVMQAGFIGAWGEWHTSKNFVDGPSGAGPRKNVFNALLAAVPASRTIGLRYPAYKRMFYGTAPTTAANQASGSAIARAGHINDCFVSGEDDVGTYQYEPMETLKTYLAEDTKYVPIGGETCAVHARNSCATTLSEMSRFHWAYINDDYHGDVLNRWQSEGCRPDIERKLGYRLALTSANLPSAVRPGGSFVLDLNLKNEGFAAPTNKRPVFVVLEGQGQRLTAELTVDPRTWLPGEHRVTARLRLPNNLALGTYRLALWLPDSETALRTRPEYSIQLANSGTWDAARGDNTLLNISVSASAAGSSDPAAQTFAVIP
jgi:hypothetical protein